MAEVFARRVQVVLAGLLVTALSVAPASAGEPDTDWVRRLEVWANGVALDERGNVSVAAHDGPYPGVWRSRAILMRYRPGGARAWVRRWRPAASWAQGVVVEVGPDGSVYVAGNIGMEGFEGWAWFLDRYSPEGRRLWHRAAPGWRDLLATNVTSMAVGAGMVVIGGHAFGCCSKAADEGYVRAYSQDGALLWHHEVEGPGRWGANHDGVGDVAIGAKGTVYLTGWVETRPRSDVGERVDVEVLIQKLSADGHEIWTRVLRDHKGRDVDHGVGISARGNTLVVSAFMSGGWITQHGSDVGHGWLGRLTFDGKVRWTRTWGTKAKRAAQPEAVAIGPDGTVYVVGASRDPRDKGTDAFVRAYTPNGNRLFEVSLGEARYLWATDVDAEGAMLAVSGNRSGRNRVWRLLGGRVWRLTL